MVLTTYYLFLGQYALSLTNKKESLANKIKVLISLITTTVTVPIE